MHGPSHPLLQHSSSYSSPSSSLSQWSSAGPNPAPAASTASGVEPGRGVQEHRQGIDDTSWQDGAPTNRRRKRRTEGFSCFACRHAKRLCDREHPCGRCVRLGLHCVPQTRGPGRPPSNKRKKMMHAAAGEGASSVGEGGRAIALHHAATRMQQGSAPSAAQYQGQAHSAGPRPPYPRLPPSLERGHESGGGGGLSERGSAVRAFLEGSHLPCPPRAPHLYHPQPQPQPLPQPATALYAPQQQQQQQQQQRPGGSSVLFGGLGALSGEVLQQRACNALLLLQRGHRPATPTQAQQAWQHSHHQQQQQQQQEAAALLAGGWGIEAGAGRGSSGAMVWAASSSPPSSALAPRPTARESASWHVRGGGVSSGSREEGGLLGRLAVGEAEGGKGQGQQGDTWQPLMALWAARRELASSSPILPFSSSSDSQGTGMGGRGRPLFHTTTTEHHHQQQQQQHAPTGTATGTHHGHYGSRGAL